MDIAHKKCLEEMSKDQVITICLEQEETIRCKKDEIISLNQILTEKQFMIDTLLKVVKYQNGLND